MKTNREVVSEAMHRLNALNADQRLSKRAVLSTLRDMAAKVIREKSDNRRLFQNSDLYVTVKLAFEPFNDDLVRSVLKLPERYDTTYSHIIRLFSLDGSAEFISTTAHELQYKQARKYKDPFKKYFYIEDNYVYVAHPDVEQVKLSGIFKEPAKAKLLDVDAVVPSCMFPLDDFFVCPQDYLGDVIELTVQKYTGTIQIKATEDQNPDANALR